MMKCVEQLVKGKRDAVGNHRYEQVESCYDRTHILGKYIYFRTAICTVDYQTQLFKIDNGGWDTQSTNRAIKDYRTFFNDYGMREVFDTFYRMADYLTEREYYRCYYGSLEYARFEVTMTKHKTEDGKKYAEIVVADESKDKCDTYTFFYKGPKTFKEALTKTIGHHFPI